MQWLVSPRFDLSMVALPLSVALLVWSLLPDGFGRPLWAYALFIVSFDVAHVWTTGFLTYFDPVARAKRGRLLAGVLGGAFLTSFVIHAYSPVVFWTALAYIAIGHFIKQQLGFLRLYAARSGKGTSRDRRWDGVTLWVGALGAVGLWHADPTERFDWFDAGETFALMLPEAAAPVIGIAMACAGVSWCVREAIVAGRTGCASWGRWVWMVASWFTWWMGLRVADSFFVAAAFINLFHGIPYTMLVWHRLRSNPAHREARPHFVTRMVRAGRWPLFYAVVLVAALLEESLWDAIVWHQYTEHLPLAMPEMQRSLWLSFWISMLSLPQVVHYYLDGVLWRGGAANEDLRAMVQASERRGTRHADR